MSFEEFQDDRHGYRNGTFLAILKLCCYDASQIVSAQSDLWF